jgi:broad specificity phosphatase PhoE
MHLVPGLAEIHCGAVEGLPLREIKNSFRDEWTRNEAQQDESFAWPGGETYREFRIRVLSAINSIAAAHPGGSVLVVTHAGVVNQILGSLAGQSAARWENYRPGNTAVTEVLWTSDSGRLVRFDDRSHLD